MSAVVKPRYRQNTQKRRTELLRRLWLYVALVVLLYAGLGWLSYLTRMQVSGIQLSGNVIIEDAEMSAAINEHMSHRRFGLYSGYNKFLVRKEDLRKTLAEQFPRADRIAVEKQGNVIHVSLIERRGSSVLCDYVEGSVVETAASQECFLLDKTGFVFDDSFEFFGSLYFKYITNIETDPIGTYVFQDAQYFANLQMFLEDVDLLGTLVAIDYRDPTQHILYFRNPKNPANISELYFTAEQSFEQLVVNIESVIDSDVFAGSIPRSLDYLDMRFENRVYYTFHDDVQEILLETEQAEE